MSSQVAALSLPTLMIIVIGPVLFLVALIFSLRAGEFSWPNISVLGIAALTLMLPSIQKFSVSKDSLSFELFQKGIETSRDALDALQKSTEDNAKGLSALRDTMTEIKSSYASLISKQTDVLTATIQKGGTGNAAPPTASETRNLDLIQEDLRRAQSGVSQKLDQADSNLNSFRNNNAVVQGKIRDIDAVIRQIPKF